MKIRFWGLIAFDIATMCVIARTGSFKLTMALVMILLLTNILLAMVFRRTPSPRTGSSMGDITSSFHWTSWSDYIPVLGGITCISIGIFELSWKPCVVGIIAIGIGFWRIWAKGRVRQALHDRH